MYSPTLWRFKVRDLQTRGCCSCRSLVIPSGLCPASISSVALLLPRVFPAFASLQAENAWVLDSRHRIFLPKEPYFCCGVGTAAQHAKEPLLVFSRAPSILFVHSINPCDPQRNRSCVDYISVVPVTQKQPRKTLPDEFATGTSTFVDPPSRPGRPNRVLLG